MPSASDALETEKYCELCRIWLRDEAQYGFHLEGRKHRRQLRRTYLERLRADVGSGRVRGGDPVRQERMRVI